MLKTIPIIAVIEHVPMKVGTFLNVSTAHGCVYRHVKDCRRQGAAREQPIRDAGGVPVLVGLAMPASNKYLSTDMSLNMI